MLSTCTSSAWVTKVERVLHSFYALVNSSTKQDRLIFFVSLGLDNFGTSTLIDHSLSCQLRRVELKQISSGLIHTFFSPLRIPGRSPGFYSNIFYHVDSLGMVVLSPSAIPSYMNDLWVFWWADEQGTSEGWWRLQHIPERLRSIEVRTGNMLARKIPSFLVPNSLLHESALFILSEVLTGTGGVVL